MKCQGRQIRTHEGQGPQVGVADKWHIVEVESLGSRPKESQNLQENAIEKKLDMKTQRKSTFSSAHSSVSDLENR